MGRFSITVLSVLMLTSSNAYATYNAGYIGDKAIVIGSDSRQVSPNGAFQSDNICKIAILDNNTAFTLDGVARYSYDNMHKSLDITNMAKVFYLTAEGVITKRATDFAMFVRDHLNSENIDIAALGRGNYTELVFAGFENRKPVISIRWVAYNFALLKYELVDQVENGGVKAADYIEPILVPFSMPTLTKKVQNDHDYGVVEKDATFSGLNHEAALVFYVVSKMSEYRPNIGGKTSVLILREGYDPEWFSRTDSCR